MRHLTISEAAEALQLSVPTIKRYIYDGKLRSTKLPGGQHRIPSTEVERLLTGDAATEDASREVPADAATEERLAVLERWVTELEGEVERLNGALEVMARFLSEQHPSLPLGQADAGGDQPRRIAVLGPGCRRCRALYDRLHRVVSSLPGRTATIEMVSSLDDIVAYGPLLTPAITVDDQVVRSGRVPSGAALKKLLQPNLE